MTKNSSAAVVDPLHYLPMEKQNIGYFLKLRADEDGRRPYLTIGGRTYSFAETDRLCRALARGLAGKGIGAGHRVLMLMANSAEFVFTWYACSLIGAAVVPLNPGLKGMLLEAVIDNTQAHALVMDRGLAEALDSLQPRYLAMLPWIAVRGGVDGLARPAGGGALLDFEELYAHEGGDPEIERDYLRLNLISYTSGTTGPAKGVMLPTAQCFSSACTYMRLSGMSRDDVLYSPLPLFHGLSSRMCVLPALVLGAHAVIDERFSASGFWERAARAQATLAYVVHAIVPLIHAQPPGPFDRAHKVRAVFNAPHLLEFEERFGVRTLEAFAMTETSYLLYRNFPERVLGSTGRVHEDWEVLLVDDRGDPVPVGHPGEMVARPRKAGIMMQGYFNNADATVSAWRDLWFHTGDILKRDEDGNFYYLDRKQSRIRRRGENVSSFDVERCVASHDDIVECAALAYPAGDGEDEIRVVAVCRDGAALTPAQLHQWLQSRLPKFMVPRYIEFLCALPRTGTGKVEKQRLAKQGLGAAAWDAARV